MSGQVKLNLIGGEWCASADDQTAAVYDPATDAVLAQVPSVSYGLT